MSIDVTAWGADTPISMPTPPSAGQPGLISLGDGFTMTQGGPAPDLDLVTWEEYVTPTYAPINHTDHGGSSG